VTTDSYQLFSDEVFAAYELLYRCVFVLRDIKSTLKKLFDFSQDATNYDKKDKRLTSKTLVEFEKLIILQSSMVECGLHYENKIKVAKKSLFDTSSLFFSIS
jgi:hypothetical protein